MGNLTNKRGQGLVEYILVVVLMGILAITAINKLSSKTQKGFSVATEKLSNEFDGI